ncbi:hypothetical protein D5086_013975 [Populus alba]|uniref:Uncharacterized protein n=1 Tax=Populus alba TaxID=43335 RepID=A0ACC4C7B9_POPAL
MEISIAPPKEESIQIREVWNDNLEEEFALIREIVDQFNYVAMDTEFPGVVLRPVGNFKNINDYNYQTLKDNVDMKLRDNFFSGSAKKYAGVLYGLGVENGQNTS